MIALDILMPFVDATEKVYREVMAAPLRRTAIRPTSSPLTLQVPAAVAGFGGAIQGHCALSVNGALEDHAADLLKKIMAHAQRALEPTRHRLQGTPPVVLLDPVAKVIHAPGSTAQVVCFEAGEGVSIVLTLVIIPDAT